MPDGPTYEDCDLSDPYTAKRLIEDQRAEIKRLRAERLKLDRRIRNQRISLRENWEIVEMRRKWLGSDTARRMYVALLKRYQAQKAEIDLLCAALRAVADWENKRLAQDYEEIEWAPVMKLVCAALVQK